MLPRNFFDWIVLFFFFFFFLDFGILMVSSVAWYLGNHLEQRLYYSDKALRGNNTVKKVSVKHFELSPVSEFVSSSIPSWQILTAHAQPFREARDLAFCLKVPLDSLLVWASSGGSGETARMRRLAWTFAVRIGDKYQIRLTRSNYARDTLHTVWMQSSDDMVNFKHTLARKGLGLSYW